MKKILIISILFLIACKKENVNPKQEKSNLSVSNNIQDTTSTQTETVNLFESNSDDSIYITSNQVDENGYLYSSDDYIVRIDVHTPDSIKVGSYMNEYLISNVNYGLDLIHGIVLGDGSKGAVRLGESSCQINTLEVTQVRNDSVWIVYDVDWYYTHWLYTDRNKSGNIKAELNGFKYR